MADLISGQISIGTYIASALEGDPENNPKYKKLSDSKFKKLIEKLNGERDIYGFATILSFTRKLKA